MALKFNTFRANRYLRSKFVEGKFLLAAEATDLELEILDLLREQVRNMIGDVAIEDAWKVEKLSDTELLIKPGEAYFKGLPYSMRGGKDQLVSGAVLSIGTVPTGVTVSDDSTGDGKVLTFGTVGTPNGGNVTPTNNYRIVVTAREELITEVQDEFLQNANLTEPTQQKIRLVFQLNIVPESIQDESPIPYRDENSVAEDAALTPTNFPDTGNDNQPNFVNQISVSPTVGSGDLVSLNALSGAEVIDGRDLELIINNPVGANPIPDSPTAQASFSNGKFFDSNGTEYHINFVTNDTVSGRVRIVIDKEYQQENPVIDGAGGRPYILKKRDVFVTDNINGVPSGKLHWPIATINWDTNNGFEHESSVTDLRTSIDKLNNYIGTVNTKFNLKVTDGGTIDYNNSTSLLTWSGDISLFNPHGSEMTITAANAPIVDGGSLMYDLKLAAGGALEKGTLALNVTAAGSTSTLDSVSLSNVKVGNIVVDSGGVVAEITAIDDVNDTITTSPALSNTGAATVYLDSFGPGKAPLDSIKFCLASRKGSKVYVAGLELEDGESGQIGDGSSQELLTFVGSTGDSDDSPNYSSEVYVTDGDSLVVAISALDAGIDALAATVAAINWKDPVANFAALPGSGNVDGDVRLVLDTRVAYHWDNSGMEWLPLTRINGGIKVIGGGTLNYLAVGAGSSPFSLTQTSVPTENNVNTTSNWRGQTFTTTGDWDVDTVGFYYRTFGGSISGTITYKIYSTSGGLPDTLLGTSNTLDASTITGSTTLFNLTFASPVSLSSGVQYAIVMDFDSVTFSNTLGIGVDLADPYAGGTIVSSPDSGSSWSSNSGQDLGFNIEGDEITASSNELSFTSDLYLEKLGLNYTDNTIPTSESPIDFPNDKDVAYVVPNNSPGGGNLLVTVDTLDNAPVDSVVIARRDGSDVIVGSSSIRLKSGESKQLYKGITDQEEDKLYGQKTSFFRSDESIVWTGSDIEFTTDIVLEMLKNDGTIQTYTVLAADSPITLTSGQYAYLTVDRTQSSETLSFSVGTAPGESSAGSEVIIFGKRVDVSGEGYLHLPLHKQVLEPGQSVRLGASGGAGTGFVKVDFIDPISTVLPSGSSVTIDGISGVNGDLVLYTNLSSGNNRVYELSGVGSAIAWEAKRVFDNEFDPTDGDSVIARKGDAFSEQIAIFDGTDFKANDVVRLFDGVSANFWELGSIKNTTLLNNSIDSVFEVNVTGSENIIVSYSITRGSNKETGQLYITSDGSTAQVSRNASYIGSIETEFTADINTGNLRLRYDTEDTGNNADMKYFLMRWSDSLGGPTGVPNYSGATGSTVSAAGTLGDIQYHGSGGLLEGDTRFKWDTSGFLDFNGQEITSLSSGITINDNQASLATLFSYAHATYPNAIIDYSIERNGEFRTGTIHVAANSSTAADNDLFVETGTTGVTLSADISGANVQINYTSTSTGFTGTFKYSIRRWS